MDSASVLVQEGIRLAAMGGHAEAVALFTRAVEMEPRNETAWLWLAELAEDYERQLECLEEVLDINPKNQVAQEGLASLKASRPATDRAHTDDGSVAEPVSRSTTPGAVDEQPATTECRRCGADNPATNIFCGRCGASLAEPSHQPVEPDEVGPDESPPDVEERPPVVQEQVRPRSAAAMESSKQDGRGHGVRWFIVGGVGVGVSLLALCTVAWASGLVGVKGLNGTQLLPGGGAKATTPAMPSSATTPASGSSADTQYFACAQDVMIEWAKLTGDATQGATDLARGTGVEDIVGFCDDQVEWEQRAQRLQDDHSRCGAPTNVNLRAAQQYVENGLGETVAGIGFFGSFCEELANFGADWGALTTGDARLQSGNQWADRASVEMEKYSP